jgi:hypothetical protein
VGGADGVGASAPAPSPAGDRVELTNSTEKLGKILAAQAQTRAQRVASLAESVQSGRHTPDAHASSRALVAETLSATAGEKAVPPGK